MASSSTSSESSIWIKSSEIGVKSSSNCNVDWYGILVFAALVYASSQLTWLWAHAYHFFSPLGVLSGALFTGKGGRPGPFTPAKLNLSKLTSDSSWRFEWYGILVLAAFVCLSNQLTWSWAHAYHFFSPLGVFSGALFVGKGGSPGPNLPARLKNSLSASSWTSEWYGSLV